MSAHLRRELLRKKRDNLQRKAAQIDKRLEEEPRNQFESSVFQYVREMCRNPTVFFGDEAEDHVERMIESMRDERPHNFSLHTVFDFGHSILGDEFLLTGDVVFDAAMLSGLKIVSGVENVCGMIVNRDHGTCVIFARRWATPSSEQ